MLHLQALDGEDLEVISAHMQDALVRVGDMRFVTNRRQFALAANRFAWEMAPAEERHRAGLHFENVLAVQRHGFTQADHEQILSILAISFSPQDAPAGEVTITFSGDKALKLKVEYLDAGMKDLGLSWQASRTPVHGG
jgi:hypothetical protein